MKSIKHSRSTSGSNQIIRTATRRCQSTNISREQKHASMASRDAAPTIDLPDGKPYKIGIVTAQWNADITRALLEGARNTLSHAGVLAEHIEELSVPGSFELPWGARQLMKADKKDAIICLGCII